MTSVMRSLAGTVRSITGFALAACLLCCGNSGSSGTSGPPGSFNSATTGSICMRSGGGFCDGEIGCPDTVGCNWCQCDTAGLVCNQAACPARTKLTCTTTADCATDEDCVYDPDCGATTGRCVRRNICAYPPLMSSPIAPPPFTFCDCSGNTVTQPTGCGIGQPYKHYGPC